MANGCPIAAKRLLGNHFSFPLDCGAIFLDGQPVFGASKTIRGIVVALLVTAFGGFLLTESWALGLVVGSASMVGDLLSSFVKRRLGFPPSAQATGLDQIFEVVLPALAVMPLLSLTWIDVLAIIVLFFVGEIVLSKWLLRLGFRDHPY
ncbi:CDP-archaeol synthase [Tropicimonas sp. IMCC6043]|nr:CDP-archaeol synthase [Tropicimonas sp. IMCC6043]